MPNTLLASLSASIAAVGAPVSPPEMVGTWSMMKDGFGFTVTVEPVLNGRQYQQVQTLDETGLEVSRAIWDFNTRTGVWRKTEFLQSGLRTTFEQRGDGGALALEQISLDSKVYDDPPARLLYRKGNADEIVMDWQTRDGDAWTPRETPFVLKRVDRPQPRERIAFITNRDGNWEIYACNTDGSEPTNLTNHPGADHYPRWKAGGTRLAWLTDRDDNGWQRYDADTDGTDTAPYPIQDMTGQRAFGKFPEVSPDGSWVVFADERPIGSNGGSGGESGSNDTEAKVDLNLYIARFDGGGERPLAHATGEDYRPKWSPDGTKVLFVSERDGNAELYVVDVRTNQLTRLTESEGIDRYARWSPDGTQIVFASERDVPGALELYLMDADGTNVRRLTNNDAEDGEPCWSPAGTHIAFRSSATGDSEVMVIDLATGEIMNITNAPESYDAEPQWVGR